MTMWGEVEEHIQATYVPWSPGPGPNSLKVVLDVGEGRSQVVVLALQTTDDGDWVEILTPIAREQDIDARTALLQNCKVMVGAFALTERGMFVFRYALSLRDLDLRNLDSCVAIVARYGDAVEKVATAGGDVF